MTVLAPIGAITTLEALNQHLVGPNAKLFGVMALGAESSIETYETTVRTMINDRGHIHGLHAPNAIADWISTRDFNVGSPNNYNFHYLFSDETAATAYRDLCKARDIDLPERMLDSDPDFVSLRMIDIEPNRDSLEDYYADERLEDAAEDDRRAFERSWDREMDRLYDEDMREERANRANVLIYADDDGSGTSLGAILQAAILKKAQS